MIGSVRARHRATGVGRRLFGFAPILLLAGMAAMAGCGRKEKPAGDGGPVLVFAAASLADVLPRVAAAWAAPGRPRPVFTFDASSRLARQVESGAPADLFVSADTAWMNELARAGRLDQATRVDLLGNRLVVVIPADPSRAPAGVARLADLAGPAVRRLALAGEQVPAGRYARAALARAGLLDRLESRIVNGDNVRTALAWVASGDVDAAIVYSSDLLAEPRVRRAAVVPDELTPPILYPAAVLNSATNAAGARAFLEFCRGPEATRLFREAGFRVPPGGAGADPKRGATAPEGATGAPTSGVTGR